MWVSIFENGFIDQEFEMVLNFEFSVDYDSLCLKNSFDSLINSRGSNLSSYALYIIIGCLSLQI